MTVGIASAGIDLDQIFDLATLYDTLAAVTDIGYGASKLDLNTRYENINYGTAAAVTGIKTFAAGDDLNTFFAKIGTTLKTSLPTFPNAFTTSPQNGSMTVTITGGPGGGYDYLWSATTTGTTTFTINSGQGTATITWTATGVSGEPGNITVSCTVTSLLTGVDRKAYTTMRFNIPGGG